MMRKVQIILSLLISFVLFSGCHPGKKANSDGIIISGKLNFNGEDRVYLQLLNPLEVVTIDSVSVNKNGTFSFKQQTKEANFYIIKTNDRDFITLLMEPGETAKIEADASQLSDNYKIDGSPGSLLIMELNNRLNNAYKRVDSLSRKFKEIQGKPGFIEKKALLDTAYNMIFNEHKNYLKLFIAKNSSSLAAIIALYQNLGRRPMLTMKDDMPVFEKTAHKLLLAYPENPHVIALNKRVSEIKKTGEELKIARARIVADSVAPVIAMKDTSGHIFSLSSLKGKTVLLYFTASSCVPCLAESPELIKLYRKYHSKNFEIFSVSIEKSRGEWRSYLIAGKIPWICVSDLNFWDSPVVKTYGLDKLPCMILINKEGRIIAPDISIKELEVKLMNILKKQAV